MTMEPGRAATLAAGSETSGEASRVGVGCWLGVLVAAVLAGMGAWALGESFYGYFGAALKPVTTMGYLSFRASPAEMTAANIKNALVPYVALAALAPLTLGVVGGLARGNPARGARGGLIGLAAGVLLTVAATIPALIGYWAYFGEEPLTDKLLVPYLTHATSWAGVGVGAGLALGIGLGARRSSIIRAVVAGVVGVLAGAAVYEFAGAALFPLDRTTLPLSASRESRLLARLVVAALASVFALGSLARSSAPARSAVGAGS